MGYEELKTLAETYPPQEQESLLALSQEFRSRDEREFLELAAIATDVSLDSVLNLGLEPEANPQFWDAFRLHYPNVGLETLSGSSEERLTGLANAAKGKYFEVLVRDRLNAGERLGELKLQPGQEALLAGSPTQPGWDLQIVNADGSIDELLQLKASSSMSYVKQALERYPNIRVATPSEIDDAADSVLGTDISDDQMTRMANAQIGEMGENTVDNLIDKGAEAAFDSIPFVSMVAAGVIEGGRYLTGRSTLRESLRRGAKRVGRAAVYDVIGTALAPTGIAVPLTVGLGVAERRITGLVKLGDHLESKTRELRQLTAQIQPAQ